MTWKKVGEITSRVGVYEKNNCGPPSTPTPSLMTRHQFGVTVAVILGVIQGCLFGLILVGIFNHPIGVVVGGIIGGYVTYCEECP